MILADSSVWIDHLRRADERLSTLLESGLVLVHPFVIGELACGMIRHRRTVLDLLTDLPSVPAATNEEAMTLVERHRLMGSGLGIVDVHLLASTALAHGARLWTKDVRLAAAAARLKPGYAARQ